VEHAAALQKRSAVHRLAAVLAKLDRVPAHGASSDRQRVARQRLERAAPGRANPRAAARAAAVLLPGGEEGAARAERLATCGLVAHPSGCLQ
jgi:hypothetical protein